MVALRRGGFSKDMAPDARLSLFLGSVVRPIIHTINKNKRKEQKTER